MAIGPSNHEHTDHSPAQLSTTEARQGNPRKMNLVVLVVGLILAILVAIALLAWAYSGRPGNPG